MAPGCIALEQALREMKAAAPGGHKYQLGTEYKGTFPLISGVPRQCFHFPTVPAELGLGLSQGTDFLVFWAGVGEEQSEGEKLTVIYRGLYLGNHDMSLFI